MSDYLAGWTLSRKRFDDEVLGLNAAQLNWKLHPNVLTIGQMAIHVAGVELSFVSQLTGLELTPEQTRLKMAATEGAVNDNPFPYEDSEITPEFVAECLAATRPLAQALLEANDPVIRDKEIKSALGPMITGAGAMIRFVFHPGYHQGQAHMMRTAPGFPA